MSECRLTYCLNQPTQPGTTLIGLDDVGFSEAIGTTAGGEPIFEGGTAGASPVFEIPFGGLVRIYNTGSVSHTIEADDASWSITIPAGSSGEADLDSQTFGTTGFSCTTHLGEDLEPLKRGSFKVVAVGAVDLNQSTDNHGEGCCRASIRLNIRAQYTGYTDFNNSVYPKYLKRKITTTFYSWTAPASPIETSWKGEVIAPGTVIPEVGLLYVERIRSPFFQREARPEYIYSGNNETFHAYAGTRVGGRGDLIRDEFDNTFNVREFFLLRPGWTQTSATRREQVIEWWAYVDFDYENPVFVQNAGIEVEEFSEPYAWEDFTAKIIELLGQEQDGGVDLFGAITWPYCQAELRWLRNAGCVNKNDLQCCQSPSQNVSGTPRNYQYDDNHGEESADWPLPNVFPPYCTNPSSCGGFGNTTTPHEYGCVTEDILNSENGLYPANANSDDNLSAFKTLDWPLWRQGPANSPYRNECASQQLQDDIISPPTQFMSQITYDTTGSGISIVWSPVKRWWNAAFCRKLWEDLGEGPELILCDHSCDEFTGTDLIPDSATFDANGEYEIQNLTTGKTYQFNGGAPIAGETLESSGETLSEGHFTKATTQAIIKGPPETPVQSVVRGNINYAPCARIDDPASNPELYNASLGLSSDWSTLGWHLTIPAGAVWTRFAEISCPNHSLATNPPCGCPP